MFVVTVKQDIGLYIIVSDAYGELYNSYTRFAVHTAHTMKSKRGEKRERLKWLKKLTGS